jgi:hypothetical protein
VAAHGVAGSGGEVAPVKRAGCYLALLHQPFSISWVPEKSCKFKSSTGSWRAAFHSRHLIRKQSQLFAIQIGLTAVMRFNSMGGAMVSTASPAPTRLTQD